MTDPLVQIRRDDPIRLAIATVGTSTIRGLAMPAAAKANARPKLAMLASAVAGSIPFGATLVGLERVSLAQ